MQTSKPPRSQRGKRPLLVAMVLGTALSALGSAQAQSPPTSQATLQAVTDMSRYCTTCWRNARLSPDCWDDCTQEVFGRLLERLPPDSWNSILQAEGDERQEFVRAIDTVKKRAQRARKWFSADLDDLADRQDSEAAAVKDKKESLRRAVAEVLCPRQQQIMQLAMEGWSPQQIADKMEMRVERVSDEKYKAVRKLREACQSSSAV